MVRLHRFAVLTVVVMFLVVLMGALVTNTGSGDGCGPSWPLCKGSFLPDWDYAAIIEFSHRGISTLGGLLTLLLTLLVWRRGERPLVRWLAVGALCFVILQGMLGAAAVLWPQPKAVLALHFGISLLCFSGVVLVAALLANPATGAAVRPVPAPFRRLVWWVAIFNYGVVYLGAYVRHVQAGAACLGWPLCNGKWLPTLYGPVGANVAHRAAAALAVLLVLQMAILAQRWASDRPVIRRAANLALGLVLLQVVSGAVMALGYLNLLTQMLHTAIITLYWGALSYLCLAVLPIAGEADRSLNRQSPSLNRGAAPPAPAGGR